MQSGFYRVDIDNNKLSNGFFAVRYRYSTDGKQISVSKTSLEELERTILENNLPWKVINQERAAKTRAFNQDFQKVKKQKQYIHNNEEVQKIHDEYHDKTSQVRDEYHDKISQVRDEYHDKISQVHDEYHDKISQILQKHRDKDYQQRMALIRNFVNDMNDENFYKK